MWHRGRTDQTRALGGLTGECSVGGDIDDRTSGANGEGKGKKEKRTAWMPRAYIWARWRVRLVTPRDGHPSDARELPLQLILASGERYTRMRPARPPMTFQFEAHIQFSLVGRRPTCPCHAYFCCERIRLWTVSCHAAQKTSGSDAVWMEKDKTRLSGKTDGMRFEPSRDRNSSSPDALGAWRHATRSPNPNRAFLRLAPVGFVLGPHQLGPR